MPDAVALHGVLPALITPFSADGARIDADALAAIVERLVRAGVGGLVPGGSTGEFTTLSTAERRELVEVTVAAAAGRVPVVAGTGALSTRETAELSVHAERSGADAVMIVPPFYDALSWRELRAHYAAVAEQISIPIMYYNLPSATGVKLDLAQFRELQRVAGVTSLKDTGGDAVAATELVQAGDSAPTLLNGWDTLTFARWPRGCARSCGEPRRSSPRSASPCTGCSSTRSTCPRRATCGPASGRSARSWRAAATRRRSRPPAGSSATRPGRPARRCSRSPTRTRPSSDACSTTRGTHPRRLSPPRRGREASGTRPRMACC
jgi:hypothetical protein